MLAFFYAGLLQATCHFSGQQASPRKENFVHTLTERRQRCSPQIAAATGKSTLLQSAVSGQFGLESSSFVMHSSALGKATLTPETSKAYFIAYFIAYFCDHDCALKFMNLLWSAVLCKDLPQPIRTNRQGKHSSRWCSCSHPVTPSATQPDKLLSTRETEKSAKVHAQSQS